MYKNEFPLLEKSSYFTSPFLKSFICLFLVFLKIYFFNYIWVCLNAGAQGVRRDSQITWTWSYRHLWATKCRCWKLNLVPPKEQNTLLITEPSLLPFSGFRDKVLCTLGYPQELSVADDCFELPMPKLLPTLKLQDILYKSILDLVGLKLLVQELFTITVI